MDGRLTQPVGEQGALAEAGRRRDEHESSLGGGVELFPQPLAVDVAPAARLDAELRRDQGIAPGHLHVTVSLPVRAARSRTRLRKCQGGDAGRTVPFDTTSLEPEPKRATRRSSTPKSIRG